MHRDLTQLVRGWWDCRRFVCWNVQSTNLLNVDCSSSGMYYCSLSLSKLLVHVIVLEKAGGGCDGCTCLQDKDEELFSLLFSKHQTTLLLHPKRIITPPWVPRAAVAPSSPGGADLWVWRGLYFPSQGNCSSGSAALPVFPCKKGYFFSFGK